MTADLHRGARTGNLELVRTQISKGCDVNSKVAKDLWTPLLWAAHNGHDPIVQLLVENGAQINAQSKKGTTALHWSIQNKHYNTAHLLLNLGASINITDKDSWTALHWASHNGSKSLVEELLRRGSYVDARSRNNSTALHWACENGHDEVALVLIENGASPAAVNASGKSPGDLLSGANQLGLGVGNHANQVLRKFLIEASSSPVASLSPSTAHCATTTTTAIGFLSSPSSPSSNGLSMSPPSSLECSEENTMDGEHNDHGTFASQQGPLFAPDSSASSSSLLNASAHRVMQSQNNYIELLKGTIGKLAKKLEMEKRNREELQLQQRELQTLHRRQMHEQQRQVEAQRAIILEQEDKLSHMSRLSVVSSNSLTCPIDMEPYQATGDRRPCLCRSCGKSLCVACYNRVSNGKCPFCNSPIKTADGCTGILISRGSPLINRDLVDLLEAQESKGMGERNHQENSDEF